MNKKYLFFLLLLLLFFGSLFVYFNQVVRTRPEVKTEQPAPAPTATPLPEPLLSPYATDAAILKIEADLKILEKEIEAVDLEESRLLPPSLDLQVSY